MNQYIPHTVFVLRGAAGPGKVRLPNNLLIVGCVNIGWKLISFSILMEFIILTHPNLASIT